MARGFTGLGAARARAAAGFGIDSGKLLVTVEAEFRNLHWNSRRPGYFVSRGRVPGCISWVLGTAQGNVRIGVACRPPRHPDLRGLLAQLAPLLDFDHAQLLEQRGGLRAPPDPPEAGERLS